MATRQIKNLKVENGTLLESKNKKYEDKKGTNHHSHSSNNNQPLHTAQTLTANIKSKPSKADAILALILAAFCVVPYLNYFFCTLAIILAYKSLRKSYAQPKIFGGRTLAYTALIISSLALILSIGALLFPDYFVNPEVIRLANQTVANQSTQITQLP